MRELSSLHEYLECKGASETVHSTGNPLHSVPAADPGRVSQQIGTIVQPIYADQISMADRATPMQGWGCAVDACFLSARTACGLIGKPHEQKFPGSRI